MLRSQSFIVFSSAEGLICPMKILWGSSRPSVRRSTGPHPAEEDEPGPHPAEGAGPHPEEDHHIVAEESNRQNTESKHKEYPVAKCVIRTQQAKHRATKNNWCLIIEGLWDWSASRKATATPSKAWGSNPMKPYEVPFCGPGWAKPRKAPEAPMGHL